MIVKQLQTGSLSTCMWELVRPSSGSSSSPWDLPLIILSGQMSPLVHKINFYPRTALSIKSKLLHLAIILETNVYLQ